MKLLCEYQGCYFVSEPLLSGPDGSDKITVWEKIQNKLIDINDLDNMAEIIGIDHITVIKPGSVIAELKPFLDKNGNKVSMGSTIGNIIGYYQPAIYKVINMDLDHVDICRIYDTWECYATHTEIPRESIEKYWTKIS